MDKEVPNSDFKPELHPRIIRITADEESPLALESLSNFLYDIVLLHDRIHLLSYKSPYEIATGLPFNRRGGRPIKKSERLQVTFVSKESPLIIEIVGSSVVAILGLIKIVSLLADWNHDREIKKLTKEIKKAELRRILRKEAKELRPNGHPDEIQKIEDILIRDVSRLDNNEQIKITKVETPKNKN